MASLSDHDITLDVSTTLDRPAVPQKVVNSRTVSLDLDCVYGAGPEATPYLYDFPKLVTGDTLAEGRHDLARFNGTALIGDSRNDENIIVSQLQAAFIAFHNAMVDALHKKRQEQLLPAAVLALDIKDLPRSAKAELFEMARDHVMVLSKSLPRSRRPWNGWAYCRVLPASQHKFKKVR